MPPPLGPHHVPPCSGFPARVFQHEYDHLDGKLYHDRMTPTVLAEIKQQVGEVWAGGGDGLVAGG
jgi:peptide deformylase